MHAWAFAYRAPAWRGSREMPFDASLTTSSHRARDQTASSRPARGEVCERLPLQGFLGIRVDSEGAVERRLRLVELVSPAVGFSGPHPELGIVGDEREDAAISFDIIGIEVHDLHIGADRLGPLL